MSNGNEAVPLKQEIIPVGPKTKHCKPRRRGGMSGAYMVETSSGSYFPSTPEPSPPTESALLKPNDDSPSQPHDISEQNVEPFVTPMSMELEDNLQSEMIELDTITGSREPSPSYGPPGDLNSVPMSASAESNVLLDGTAQRVTGEEDDAGERESGANMLQPCSAKTVFAAAVTRVDVSDSGSIGGDGGKTKEGPSDEVGSADSSRSLDAGVGAHDPGTGEGESRVTNSFPAGG